MVKPNDDTTTATKAEWVRLNIGGKCFVTTKTTLCKNTNSFFYKLLQDDPSIGLTTDKVNYLNSQCFHFKVDRFLQTN